MKTILFVGTRTNPLERGEEIRLARNMGLFVIVADYTTTGYDMSLLSGFMEVDLSNHDEAVARIVRILSEEKMVPDAIVGWTDASPEIVARLVEIFGVNGASLEAVQNARDKVRTRMILQSAHGANPHYALFNDRVSFDQAVDDVGCPAVLKPAGASGGRGVFFLSSLDEKKYIYDMFRSVCVPSTDPVYGLYSSTSIVEEELRGSEHSVGGIVSKDGHISIFAIADKRIDPTVRVQYQNVVPSCLDSVRQEAIVTVARQSVRALGLASTGFHVDVMMTDRGPKVLEVGARLGGELINSHLVPTAYGVYPYQRLLSMLTDIDTEYPDLYVRNTSTRAVMRTLYPENPGTVVAIHGLEELRHHPRVKLVCVVKGVGDRIMFPPEGYFDFHIGHVIAQVAIEEDVNSILDDLAAMVTIITR